MKRCTKAGLAFVASLMSLGAIAAPQYLDVVPLTKVIKAEVGDCAKMDTWKVPVIAWGGDIATIVANGNAKTTVSGSILDRKKLKVNLYRQDDWSKQVESYLRCETPFLRGTMGMISMAAEVTQADPRTEMVIIYQHSWSAGGDALVVKGDIRTPADLRGKTIVLQAYGPHVDYLTAILRGAGLSAGDVKIRYVEDLLVTDEHSMSPSAVFRMDKSVSAAFVITPDALALTSGGKIGTGSEDSVKGAHILLSTKTADSVIADVYAVRSDFLLKNQEAVESFVHALLLANEKTAEIVREKDSNPDAYRKAFSSAAGLLLDNEAALDDVAGMYGDMRMAGYSGNRKFFADPNYPRGFDALVSEIQPAFMQLGLLAKRVTIEHAQWDWKRLAAGLDNVAVREEPRFDTAKVQELFAERERKDTVSEGELFRFEIYFAPNQNAFSADQYRDAFDRVVKLATTYGGALLEVAGHSDPSAYLGLKKNGSSGAARMQNKQAARNLSFARAGAVKDSIIEYARNGGVTLDASQFGVVGMGVSHPNTPKCTLDAAGDIDLTCYPETKAQWDATRRVVFRVIQVEAETNVFKPLN